MGQGEGGGRPPHEPTKKTRQTVYDLVACGITQEKIACYIGIDAETLTKHYRQELDNSKTQVINKIAKSLMQKAFDGDGPSQMFYLKTQAGWREKDKDDDTKKAMSLIEQILAMKKDAK